MDIFSQKPIIFFLSTSISLLIYYIYITRDNINAFVYSEIFCWISSIILALIIVHFLNEAHKSYGDKTSIYNILIFILLIGCALCSFNTAWNASIISKW